MGIGGSGEELIAPSLSVEFDTWQGGWTEDEDSNHVGVNIATRQEPMPFSFPKINFSDTPGGAQGHFDQDDAFPYGDGDHFAVYATALITVDEDQQGDWTFGTNSDDGVRLKVAGQVVIDDNTSHPPKDNLGTLTLPPGEHYLELLYWEWRGGAEVELFAAPGVHTAFNSGFRLIDSGNGPGLHTTPAGFSVQHRRSVAWLSDLNAAERLFTGTRVPLINFSSSFGGAVGRFAGDNSFPFGDGDNYVVRAQGTFAISETRAGDWTFGINSDDGSRLLIDGQVIINDDSIHAPEDRFGTIQLDPGMHTIDLLFFENTGGAALELFAAPGMHNSFSQDFELVNIIAQNSIRLIGSEFQLWQYAVDGAVDSLAAAESAIGLGARSLGTQTVPTLLNDEQVRYAWIDYVDQILEVRVNDSQTKPAVPTLSVPVHLPELFPDLQELYFGFTAATGDAVNDHDVRSWNLRVPGTAVPVQVKINPQSPGDFDGSGKIDIVDVSYFAIQLRSTEPDFAADLTGDGRVDESDRDELILDALNTTYGDSNLDGVFNSSDLVQVFMAGQYEDLIPGNSNWESGDWNLDGDFTSADIVLAFVANGYSAAVAPIATTGHPAAALYPVAQTNISAAHVDHVAENRIDHRKSREESNRIRPRHVERQLQIATIDSIFQGRGLPNLVRDRRTA